MVETSKPMQDAIKRNGGNPTGDWELDLPIALDTLMTKEERHTRRIVIMHQPNGLKDRLPF